MNFFNPDSEDLSSYVFDRQPLGEVKSAVKKLRGEFGRKLDLPLGSMNFEALREHFLSLPKQLTEKSKAEKPDPTDFSLIPTPANGYGSLEDLKTKTSDLISGRSDKALSRAYGRLLGEFEAAQKEEREDIVNYYSLFVPAPEVLKTESTHVLISWFKWLAHMVVGILLGLKSGCAAVWGVLQNPDLYYLQLRGKIHDWAQEHPKGKWSELICAVPDLFRLYVRLLFDDNVAPSVKLQLLAALAYLVVPYDLLPEAFIGSEGLVDDAFIMASSLLNFLDGDVIPAGRLQKHWAGNPETLKKIVEGARVMGDRLDFFKEISQWWKATNQETKA